MNRLWQKLKNFDIKPAKPANTLQQNKQYVIELFDDYAQRFEKHLVQVLDYRAYEHFADFLEQVIPSDHKIENFLDLGCGTGLLAQTVATRFKPKHMVGVDLSEKMLQESRAKNIYQDLHQQELTEYLLECTDSYDLIGCTDVLVYLGELRTVFAQAYNRLTPHGYFGFALEALKNGTYRQGPSLRYQHSLRYIHDLARDLGYSKIYSRTIDLRKESGNIVGGYLVLLQK